MQIKLVELNYNNEDFYKKCWVDAMKYHASYAENCGVTDRVCAYATEQ